jgi:hypothetical protein
VAENGSTRDRFVLGSDVGAGLVVAAAIFFLSYANGGFETTTRAYAAIAAWWLIGVGAALGIGSASARLSRTAIAVPVIFGLFAVWTLVSMAWAPDRERAFAQFAQVSLYVAVLVFGLFLARVVPTSFLAGGIALALSAIAVVSLVSRLFPSTFGQSPGSAILRQIAVRLSFPVGYWNGLAIEVALAIPLLLAAMCSERSRLVRAVAALPFPIIAADMYLASSRGAFIAAAAAVIAFLVLAPRRWPAFAATVVAAGAGVVAVGALVHKKSLLNATTGSLAVQQGHRAAVVIALACLASALVWLAVSEVGHRVPTPRPLVGWITAAVFGVLAVGAVAASHPVRRFDDFKSGKLPHGVGLQVTNHLLGSSGSGRWQYWGAAVSQFRAHPLRGGGAGSWEYWWQQHGSLPIFTQFAHSIYLETMGELGVIGLLLLLGWLVLAVVGSIRAARILASPYVAALAAVGIAFFVAASYDWVWQLSALAVVGVGSLGVALGTLPSRPSPVAGRAGFLRPVLALLAVAAIVPQVVVLAEGIHMNDSRTAAAAGDLTRAQAEALAARAVEPWATSPYIQLAQLSDGERQYADARHWIGLAIDRSPQNWLVWFVAARIDRERGLHRVAAREYQRAIALNPHGLVFQHRH